MPDAEKVNPFTSPMRNSVAKLLARKVGEYLKDPQHRKEFEGWYREKYGKEYVWIKAFPNVHTSENQYP